MKTVHRSVPRTTNYIYVMLEQYQKTVYTLSNLWLLQPQVLFPVKNLRYKLMPVLFGMVLTDERLEKKAGIDFLMA